MGKSPLKLQAPQQTCHRSVQTSGESRDWFNQIQGIELIYHVTPEGREERLVHAFQMRYFFRFELDH